MAVVHYFLQDEGKNELYMYMVEGLEQNKVKFKDVISTFPEQGRFHFRFRVAVPDGKSTVSVWIDYIDPENFVPLFKGNIIVKALQLPPFSNSSLIKRVPKAYKTGLSELYKTHPAAPAQKLPIPRSASAKEMARRPSPQGTPTVKIASPEPVLHPHTDMISMSPETQTSPDSLFFPPDSHQQNQKKNNIDPTQGKTESELREEKKLQVRQAVDLKVDDYKRRMASEEQQKMEKMRSREELGEIMDRWETRNMQKNNIRALLSTVHTVLWPEAGWPPLSMSQLLSPEGVKKGYLKAMLKFHPDKHNNDPPNIKYTCERIFSAMNEAWKQFQSDNQ